MEIFAVCFPKREHRRLLKEVKALADALGERRDRDVAIAALETAAREVRPSERPGLRHLVHELRAEQARANDELAQMLEDVDRGGLRERLLAHAVEARPA
jgi:CHAD domain-containing protein